MTTDSPKGPQHKPLQSALSQLPPLESVNRPTLDTATAAYYLNRRPQTLRVFAMTGHPIRPLKFNGRLAWKVSDIKRVMGVPA